MAKPTTSLDPTTFRNRASAEFRSRLVLNREPWTAEKRRVYGQLRKKQQWEDEHPLGPGQQRRNPKGQGRRNDSHHLVAKKRAEAITALGGPVCLTCGYDHDVRALQIDHINGGGMQDRKRFNRNAYTFYKHVIAVGRTKFQVLCANCNIIKKIVKREFGKATEL